LEATKSRKISLCAIVCKNSLGFRTASVERDPPTTVQEAVERIGAIVARMEAGEINLDEGQTLIHGLQAFVDSELEIEVETLRATVARLTTLVEAGGLEA
jgi:hypothetical protein